jgi:hypothetical protein
VSDVIYYELSKDETYVRKSLIILISVNIVSTKKVAFLSDKK